MRFEDISDFKMKGLRFQFWYTVILAIPLGIVIMLFPRFVTKTCGIGDQNQTFFGISGAVYFAFGLLSLLGLRNPKKWAPILVLQFTYKVAWLIFVMGLRAMRGESKMRWPDIAMLAGYGSMIAGDVWGVPWRYIFSKDE